VRKANSYTLKTKKEESKNHRLPPSVERGGRKTQRIKGKNDVMCGLTLVADVNPQLEREQTDESLRRERKGADFAVAETRKLSQRLADGIVERAREQADEVLDEAREKADAKLTTDGPEGRAPHAAAREAVRQERGEEDAALKQERASADDTLRWERKEQSRILAALLPFEREKTDRYLLSERELSDDAVARRDDFMGMISHELRNLLAGIAIHAQVLTNQASDSDEGRRTLAGVDRIQRCVARMNRLIEDLVDIASIDAGKLVVHPQPGDVAEMISEAITSFAHVAQQKGLSLEFANGGQMLSGVFDSERMLQVISNLIDNAMRFTPSGGAITIKAAHAGDDLCISVLDTGKGIDADMREAIFERFGQVDGNDHRGLGLGLYISRCIVEAQGGRIWAENNPAGTGSAFHLTVSGRSKPATFEVR
jgi:signal transduction histidine kinase